jgi:hypothetical protein
MILHCGLWLPRRGFQPHDVLDLDQAEEFFRQAEDAMRRPLDVVAGHPFYLDGLPCLMWDYGAEALMRAALKPR